MRPIIAQRHDVDKTFGLRNGLPKVIDIEKRHNIKSTIFIRVDVIENEKDISFLRKLERCGWEIGLHLVNTINSPDMLSPKEELAFLQDKVGVEVRGVTPCGSTIGYKKDITWKVLDSLGLYYMEAHGSPPPEVKTYVMPNHLSFDIFYIRNYGEKNGYQQFKQDLTRILKDRGIATVLTHPEWFVRSVGMSLENVWMCRISKLILDLARKRRMGKVYERFLSEFDGVGFMRYIDVYNLVSLNSSS